MTTLASTRSRLVWTIFGGVAIGRVAFIMSITVASLAGETLAGKGLSGIPSAVTTFATALGATLFTRLATRVGRRTAFSLGYGLSASGAALAGISVLVENFSLLLLGMVALGLGQSTSHLARYAAADLRPANRRATAISWIVWAGTIGSVVGPLLLAVAGDFATSLGYLELAGPFFGAAIVFALASTTFATLLRPEPLSMAVDVDESDPTFPRATTRSVMSQRSVQMSLIVMGVAQAVMVLIMTMTPVQLREGGGDLGAIGRVMTAHTLGMFALAPVTGWLIQRYGSVKVMWVGSATLIGSCAIAASNSVNPNVLLVALFLLGLGWNFAFVSGSSHLLDGLDLDARLRVQGIGDTLTWTAGGIASISSGIILGATSYPTLGLVGIGLTLIAVSSIGMWGRVTPLVHPTQ